MDAETTKIIDFLYTQIGASTEINCTEYSHLTDDERNQFMSHLINAVNILDSKTILTWKNRKTDEVISQFSSNTTYKSVAIN
jgi:hypothetical protein